MSEQEKKNLNNEEMEQVTGGNLSEDLGALNRPQASVAGSCCTNPRATVAVRQQLSSALGDSCCNGGIKQQIRVKA